MSVVEPMPASKFKLPPALAGSVLAVLAAFVVGAALIAAVGVNPLTAYSALFEAALGSRNGLAETLLRTVPLALCGLGIALAFRAGVFNVGAEGQLFLGGTAAAADGVSPGRGCRASSCCRRWRLRRCWPARSGPALPPG
ncbi:MAG: hypothetical protein P0Y66_17415 [Candidatus Kaistia colombiensis]|nr:MAG: hypothetical protein P0Y66_17415 [Kaistia sp.]